MVLFEALVSGLQDAVEQGHCVLAGLVVGANRGVEVVDFQSLQFDGGLVAERVRQVS